MCISSNLVRNMKATTINIDTAYQHFQVLRSYLKTLSSEVRILDILVVSSLIGAKASNVSSHSGKNGKDNCF